MKLNALESSATPEVTGHHKHLIEHFDDENKECDLKFKPRNPQFFYRD